MTLNFRRGAAFASKYAKDYLKGKNPQDIKKIAVIRHAAIGDFMNIRPFLINMKEFFPNAKITLSVLRTAMYGIPQDLIDELHIMDKYDTNHKDKKTSFISRIRQAQTLEEQDMIFDLTDSSMSLMLVVLAKAKLKIGYAYRGIRRMFYDISTLRSDFVIEAESTQHMLNILGSKKLRPLEYGFEEKYLKEVENTIIYFAGASAKIKAWQENKFNNLIDKMLKDYPNYKHVILQGIQEDEAFLDVYENMHSKENVVLQAAMPLDETMQFLANSKCVVCNDTGIRNMAIAVQTPTVGIFFATAAFRYWPRDGKHECVFNLDYTSPSVEDVYETIKKLMFKMYEV